MKYLFVLLLIFFSFKSFSAVTITNSSYASCTPSPNFHDELIGLLFVDRDKLKAHVAAVARASTCNGYPYYYLDVSTNGGLIRFKDVNSNRSKATSISWSGADGCNFDDCKSIAEHECESVGTTLNEESYFYRGDSDYDAVCNNAPPEEPVKTSDECSTHASNSCNARGAVSDFLFTDNNDFTYECTFTCGDGSTGDENGSHAGNSDGICNQDDPNDLIDCDVPITDPDCVGCGVAFTPDETTDLPYNADGTAGTDGTGTDGITSTQGDVLINEVKKLKNENAKQEIKGTNAVVDALEQVNPVDKLQDIVDAVNNIDSGGSGGTTYDDTALRNAVNNNTNQMASDHAQGVAADLANTNAIIDAIKEGETTGVGVHTQPSENLTGFYTSVYPDGVSGMFADHIEGFKTTDFYIFLEQFKPQFSGTPPNMSFCMNFGNFMNLGCFDLVLDPRIWPALKIFILITAGFTCRKILFGG